MDLSVSIKTEKLLDPLAPYWAVLRVDVGQLTRTWLYRGGMLTMLALGAGSLLHRAVMHHKAGLLQYASVIMGELLQWGLLGGAALVVLLSAGAVSSERETVGDSVLCRGIGRYQFFLGKWHARLVSILGGFFVIGVILLLASALFLRSDVTMRGSLVALGVVTAVLAVVASFSVAVSAAVNSTLFGLAAMWLAVYGLYAVLTLFPASIFDPARFLKTLPALLRGQGDVLAACEFMRWCGGACVFAALVGMLRFGRRDL